MKSKMDMMSSDIVTRASALLAASLQGPRGTLKGTDTTAQYDAAAVPLLTGRHNKGTSWLSGCLAAGR